MRPFIVALALSAALTAFPRADERPPQAPLVVIERFLTNYHHKPVPDRVPAMLDLILADRDGNILGHKAARSLLMAHSLGWMARGQAQLVRQFEARFAAAKPGGKTCILNTLRICGDEPTRKQLAQWAADPRHGDCKGEIEATLAFLADAKRQLPRDKPARMPDDLDLLWADFLVTGDYAPVSRILDTLDQPECLREKITAKLAQGGAARADFLKVLTAMKLIEPGAEGRLIAGDLVLAWLHDRRGRLKENTHRAATQLGHLLGDSDDELKSGIVLIGAASWSLQSNLEQHARLAALLKEHCSERPVRTQDLVKKWLRIDQPTVALDAEMKRLQGTWFIASVKEEREDSTTQFAEGVMKRIAWTFDEDELQVAFDMVRGADGSYRRAPGSLVQASSFVVKADRNPKVLTLTTLDDGETLDAIYEIDGDTLRICTGPKDAALPTEFAVKPGSGSSLITLKKSPTRP